MLKNKTKRKVHKDIISEILRHTPDNEGIIYKVDFKSGCYSKDKKNKRNFKLIKND